MTEFKTVWLDPGVCYTDSKIVREAVFVNEQGYPVSEEFDDYDEICPHLVLYDGKNPVATARIFMIDGTKTAKLGRIAVLKEYRGCHLGAKLMTELIKKAKEMGAYDMYISAQSYAVPFYEKFGFCAYGEEYLDIHIPHYDMKAIIK